MTICTKNAAYSGPWFFSTSFLKFSKVRLQKHCKAVIQGEIKKKSGIWREKGDHPSPAGWVWNNRQGTSIENMKI